MIGRILIALLFVCIAFINSFAFPAKVKVMGPVAMDGTEEVTATALQRVPGHSLDDEGGTPNSTYYVAGTTWYDYQTNGTHGKTIAVDPFGNVHVAWTKGEQEGSADRHVYYNCFSAEADSFLYPGGIRVNLGSRAGFCNVAAWENGFGFPAYHDIPISNPHAVAAIDFDTCSAAFTGFEVPYPAGEPQIIWPHIDMDIDGKIHMVATESGGASAEYYARGVPAYENGYGLAIDWEQEFETPWEEASFITIDVACSRLTNRVAVAWIADPVDPVGFLDDENILLKISEDGGLNWGETISVTNLPPNDTTCCSTGGDYATCVGDTFRPWLDLSLIMDDDDNVHVAFTAQAYFAVDESCVPGPYGLIYATMWHWGEDREMYSLINQAYYINDSLANGLGVNNLMCQRPSLAIDTTNGYLYCSFQQFDSVAYSDLLYPMGEFYMSVSTDNGLTWALPTNVSNTPGMPNQPTGNDPSERDINTAKYISNGEIHTLYMHDYACGSAVSANGAEGPATLNDMIYMRIPVGDIPTLPLQEIWAFHADSSGFPDTTSSAVGDRAELPGEMMLHQNYPNPFNPTTNIQFDLAKAGNVKLAVFDVTGRQVATLVDETMNAGAHVVTFDGSGFASGVYFSLLDFDGTSMTRKMVLLK
ncbi:MAG: T9SS type A sorting domain-containing protein [Calditrichaeota bacterium]|nr:T9SS type A sorting domain-containing protein [Calditrichota bacterium]MCB9368874.1 T9SS type A sorting domain-containing protein [Calditrichota bacterium]